MKSYKEIFKIKPYISNRHTGLCINWFNYDGKKEPLVSAKVLLYKDGASSYEILTVNFLCYRGCVQYIKPFGCQVVHRLSSKSLAGLGAFVEGYWDERIEVLSSKLSLVHEYKEEYYV